MISNLFCCKLITFLSQYGYEFTCILEAKFCNKENFCNLKTFLPKPMNPKQYTHVVTDVLPFVNYRGINFKGCTFN